MFTEGQTQEILFQIERPMLTCAKRLDAAGRDEPLPVSVQVMNPRAVRAGMRPTVRFHTGTPNDTSFGVWAFAEVWSVVTDDTVDDILAQLHEGVFAA